MYRFLLTPRWLAFHLLVLAGLVAMINLGFWQLRRLDERQAFNATVVDRIDEPVAPLGVVLDENADLDSLEWRSVEATGTYLTDEQVVVVNRSQNGLAGDHAVVPLELADGSLLVVDRGFVPLGADVPPPPSGEVTVIGRLHVSQERRRGQVSDPDGELTEFQRVDLDRLAEQLPAPVVSMFIDLVSSDPPEGPVPTPIALPELDEGPHLSYAGQWFIFAACAAVGWVLAVRRSVATRRSGEGPATSDSVATNALAPSAIEMERDLDRR